MLVICNCNLLSIILRTWKGRSNFKAIFNAEVNLSAFSRFANFCSSSASCSNSIAAFIFFSSVTSFQITSNESLPPLIIFFSFLLTVIRIQIKIQQIKNIK